MDLSPVLVFLREKIGLNPESIGVLTVEKAVLEHIELSGTSDVEEYIGKLSASPKELKVLIESIVISETSFFRNNIPFKTLHSYLNQFVLSQPREQPLHILCLPCSTGEEAYSISMVLLEMELDADLFSIFAGDISDHSLKIAEAGIYGAYSFRGENLDYRKKYFSKQRDGTYILDKRVRDTVRFEQTNILADDFLFGHKPYDIIFCRNLLIYFDDVARARAIQALTKLLADKGVLFVGHAEGSSIPRFGYVTLDYPMSFAFAKKDYASLINNTLHATRQESESPLAVASVPQSVFAITPLNNQAVVVPTAANSVNSGRVATVATVTKKKPQEEAILAARKLANEGAYSQVVEICEELLSEGVESAEVYFLLGQVAGSAGDSLLAEEYLKKAIYLNADFYDALIYLSLLMEKRGNPGKAESFRKRAQRVEHRNSGSGKK